MYSSLNTELLSNEMCCFALLSSLFIGVAPGNAAAQVVTTGTAGTVPSSTNYAIAGTGSTAERSSM